MAVMVLFPQCPQDRDHVVATQEFPSARYLVQLVTHGMRYLGAHLGTIDFNKKSVLKTNLHLIICYVEHRNHDVT